jgi:multidrug efflux system membrane fusion protein
MTISEATIPASTKSIQKKPPVRPIRMRRWFVIVGGLLLLLVGILWGFNTFRNYKIAEFFANRKPPVPPVSVAEVVPHLLTGIGDLAAVHQVDVTTDVAGRITKIMFEAGASVKANDPLVQLFDEPDRGDLASFKAQATAAQLALDRSKSLAARQFGPQATVDQNQAAFDQANAAIAKSEAIISQKLVKAPFSGDLGVRRVELGQYLGPGSQIVSLTDLSKVFLNFTAAEKDRAILAVGQTVKVNVDAYPNRAFEGQITTIEPQINSDTRNIKIQAMIDNPDHSLKPGMFASTTVILPPEPAVITIPETAVDYTLYGDSVFVLKEGKDEKGEPKLTAERTFVRTGTRVGGRTVILSGLAAGDRVVAVGQLKLQSGAPVTVSKDPPPSVSANPPRY